MDADTILAIVLAVFITGAAVLGTLIEQLPALLGIGAGGRRLKPALRPLSLGGTTNRDDAPLLESRMLDRVEALERRITDLEDERDFYRALSEGPAGPSGAVRPTP